MYKVGKIKTVVVYMLLSGSLFLTACSNKKVEELRLSGIDQLEKGKYEEAIDTLNQALQAGRGEVSETQFDILLYRAEAEYMSGDLDACQTTIDTLRKVDGDQEAYVQFQTQLDAKRLVKEASDALNDDDTETAREKLDAAKAAGLTNGRDIDFDEVVYLEKTAQWEAAYDAVEKYLQNYPGDEAATREETFLKSRIEELKNNTALNEP